MENDQEIVAPETDTEQTENTEIAEEPTEPVESIEDLKKELATAQAQKEHWRKKAQTPRETPVPTASNPSGLTSGDLLAVTNAKIHEDDIERVERFAKSEGLSIKEALKSEELQAVLDLRREQRLVSDASNIGAVRAGVSKVTDEVLLSNADKGKLPENDLDIERLIQAKARENKG